MVIRAINLGSDAWRIAARVQRTVTLPYALRGWVALHTGEALIGMMRLGAVPADAPVRFVVPPGEVCTYILEYRTLGVALSCPAQPGVWEIDDPQHVKALRPLFEIVEPPEVTAKPTKLVLPAPRLF